jgi:hypothetical protein
MSDTWVQSITHLKDMPRAVTALEMLQKTASLVKPIMRRHGWVLPVLAEFFPENPGLLGTFEHIRAAIEVLIPLFVRTQSVVTGVSKPASTDYSTDVNMGQQILVRLRYAGSPDAFLPLEDVVGTMLHEVRGPVVSAFGISQNNPLQRI